MAQTFSSFSELLKDPSKITKGARIDVSKGRGTFEFIENVRTTPEGVTVFSTGGSISPSGERGGTGGQFGIFQNQFVGQSRLQQNPISFAGARGGIEGAISNLRFNVPSFPGFQAPPSKTPEKIITGPRLGEPGAIAAPGFEAQNQALAQARLQPSLGVQATPQGQDLPEATSTLEKIKQQIDALLGKVTTEGVTGTEGEFLPGLAPGQFQPSPQLTQPQPQQSREQIQQQIDQTKQQVEEKQKQLDVAKGAEELGLQVFTKEEVDALRTGQGDQPTVLPSPGDTTGTLPPPTTTTPPTGVPGAPGGAPGTTPPQDQRLADLQNQIKSIQDTLVSGLESTEKEQQIQQQLDNILAGAGLGIQQVQEQPIATGFLQGQSAAIERRAGVQALPLEQQLGRLQAQRQGSLDVGVTKLGFAENRLDDIREDIKAERAFSTEQAQLEKKLGLEKDSVKAVIGNPKLFNELTPTQQTALIPLLERQGFDFSQTQKEPPPSPKGATLSITEVDKLNLPRALVGKSEEEIFADLNSFNPPQWFRDFIELKIQQDSEFRKNVPDWNEFRQAVLLDVQKSTTTGSSSSGVSRGSELFPPKKTE